jgi:hypothetical protein
VGAVTTEGRTLVFTAHTIGENEIVHHGPQTWVWVYRASMGAFPYPGQYEAAGKKLREGGGVAGFAARGGCVGVASSLCLPCLITAVAATLLRVDSAASLSPSLTHRLLAPCATASHVSPPLSLSRSLG